MLRFCIAGAGIAGLATAVALGRGGHRISVVERRSVLDEVGAGIQLSPNATRAARNLGVLDLIEARAIESQGVRMRRARDGATLANIPLGRVAKARYGAPFLLLHRADLQQALLSAALRLPLLEVALSTTLIASESATGLASFEAPGGRSSATLDGIVRAEGLRSGAFRSGTGGPIGRGLTAWRALIPAAALPQDFALPQSVVWLGPRAHVVHYPVRDATLVNVIAVTEDDDRGWQHRGDPWAEPGDPGRLRRQLVGWHRTIAEMMEAAPAWRTWPLFDGAVSEWSKGCETVIGDAAHPMLPFLAQGASQAFEDAVALAAAVTACGTDVPAAFRMYAVMRAARTTRVQHASRRQGRIYHLGGPASLARDITLAALGPERLLARMDWLYGPTDRA